MVKLKKKKFLNLQQKKARTLEKIQNFRLMDDIFMSKVFEDKECAELLLRIILERDDLTVKEVHGQYDIKNLQGRSVRLDILAVDRASRIYNIEIQRNDEGASPKRARYNSSLIDANVSESGEKYQNLKEMYVIFITENDVLKGDLPIYHVSRIIEETGEKFKDDVHIIYVNGSKKGQDALGRLMHDFCCKNVNEMNYSILAKRVRYFKEERKGVAIMCKAIDDMLKDEMFEKTVYMVEEMLKTNALTYEQISNISNLSLEQIMEIKKDMDTSQS